MSSFCKCKRYSHFFQQNIRVYAIFNDHSVNDTLTNDIISFEQHDPEWTCSDFRTSIVKSYSIQIFRLNIVFKFVHQAL